MRPGGAFRRFAAGLLAAAGGFGAASSPSWAISSWVAAGENAGRVIFGVPAGRGGGVLLLDQQPLVALAAFHADDGELAVKAFRRAGGT